MNKKNINKTKYRKFLKGETEILMFWFLIFIRFPKIWQQYEFWRKCHSVRRERLVANCCRPFEKNRRSETFDRSKRPKCFVCREKFLQVVFQRMVKGPLQIGRDRHWRWIDNDGPLSNVWRIHDSRNEVSWRFIWVVVSYLFWVGEHFLITKSSWELQDHQKAILWREYQFFKYLGVRGECLGFTLDQGEHWLGNT